MKYAKRDYVRFKHLDGTDKIGRIISYDTLTKTYWVKVQESFSYSNTVEYRGKILGYTQGNSQFIEYLVKEDHILGIEKEEERAS